MDDQIAAEVMDERLQRLQAAINRHQPAFNAASVGQTCSGADRTHAASMPGQLLGKSPWLQSVHFTGYEGWEPAIGQLIDVELISAGPKSLAGRPKVSITA